MKTLREIFGIKSKAEKLQLQKEQEEMKENLKNKLTGLTQPAVHFTPATEKNQSKLGGCPIVDNENFIWPNSNEEPMIFLGQLDLKEIAQQHEYAWLPNEGALLFFYDIKSMPWGFDPADKGKWKVIFQRSPSINVDYPTNIERKLLIKEQYIKASKTEILPPYEDPIIQEINLSDEEIDFYFEIGDHYEKFNAHGNFPAHQVGGYPTPVQGDEMQLEAQLASNGVYQGDSKAFEGATQQDFDESKEKWKLLFQFDSDDSINAMWGDMGMLYFWVEPEKAIVNNFEDTWLVLQCT